MQGNGEKRFFRWFGAAAAGTGIGIAVGAVLGLLGGGGLGGWFWYSMRTDGFNALSDDTENLFGFLWMVALAVVGLIVGIVGGGIGGFVISSIAAAVAGSKRQ